MNQPSLQVRSDLLTDNGFACSLSMLGSCLQHSCDCTLWCSMPAHNPHEGLRSARQPYDWALHGIIALPGSYLMQGVEAELSVKQL